MINNKGLFISGIGTGVGKTVVSAVLAQHFQADYWKPVQAGDLQLTDSMTVGGLIDDHLQVYPERYRFKTAASPHQAAAAEDLRVRPEDFLLPASSRGLIVEGAGGLMVPLNEDYLMIDLAADLQLPLVLVVRDYLGCINHTLLSLQVVQYRQLPLAYLVFNGPFNPASKAVIARHIAEGTRLLELPEYSPVSRESILQTAATLTGTNK